jgi:hypothetical protein
LIIVGVILLIGRLRGHGHDGPDAASPENAARAH